MRVFIWDRRLRSMTDDWSDGEAYHHHHHRHHLLLHHSPSSSIFPFPFLSSSSSYVMISYADHFMTWMDVLTVVVVVS